MNKRGFTLIELLAVIVILAIIALIAVPIVLSIISDSKDSASLRSAEMYLKGLETSVATATINEKNITDGTYPIMSNGNVCLGTITDNKCKDEETLKVEMNGETPTSGTITIESGKVKNVTFVYTNGKTIVKDINGKLVYGVETSVKEKTLATICEYQNNGVAEKTAGALYSCEVKPETSYNFYVLTTPVEGDTTINLIMDRNICEDGTPTEEGKTCLVAWQTSGANADGPVTAMNYLYNATSTWENIDNLNITYDDEEERFTGFALDGKARLPYKSEITDPNENNIYLYENLDDDYWAYGESTKPTNTISGIPGYWTLSSAPRVEWYDCSWGVYYCGGVSIMDITNDVGVRPVINLKI